MTPVIYIIFATVGVYKYDALEEEKKLLGSIFNHLK